MTDGMKREVALTVQVAHPVAGNRAGRAGRRLLRRVAVRRGQLWPLAVVVSLEVPEPVLARLEALDDGVAGRAPVGTRSEFLRRL